MKTNHFILALMAFLSVSCQNEKSDKKSQDPPKVAVDSVQEVIVQKPVHTVATIQADKNLKLSFKIGGIIEHINVEPGEQVSREQPLAKLNSIEIDSKLKQASLAVDKAKRDFERINNLYNDSVATLEQWQNAQTALEVARADLQMARFNRRHAVIKAPHEGVVLKQLAQSGEVVGAGYPVIVLATTEKQYRVVAQVTDREWVQLKKGDSASVKMDAHPNQVFAARIEQISPLSEKYTGTYETKLIFTEQTLPVTSGMIARVKIYPRKKQPLFKIPVDALLEASGLEGYVYVFEKGKAIRRAIKIARIGAQNLYVHSGLKMGEQVITKGKSYVSAGQRVEIIEND